MTTPLKLLHVEDSESDHLIIMRELRKGGFDMTAERVDSEKAFRAALARPGWDIIILDYKLPGFGGDMALEIFKESKLDIPFILVSGTIGEEAAVAMMKTGTHDFVMKDKLGRLPAAVERELREAANRRAKRQAEEQVRQSEERFRALIENTTDLILVLNSDGTARYVSPSAVRMLGFKPDEIVGRKIADFVNLDNLPAALEKIAHRLQTSSLAERTSELRVRKKDGSYRTMEVIGTNLMDNPAVAGIVINSRDITERKQAEKELRNSEERFRRVFDDGPLGMALTDKQYHFVQANAMFCQMLGYTEQELKKLTFKDITHPDDMGDSIKKVHELEKGNISVYKTEKRYITHIPHLKAVFIVVFNSHCEFFCII